MFRQFLSYLHRRSLRREAVARLSGMTDHELHDIGVMRCEIRDVIHGRDREEARTA